MKRPDLEFRPVDTRNLGSLVELVHLVNPARIKCPPEEHVVFLVNVAETMLALASKTYGFPLEELLETVRQGAKFREQIEKKLEESS